MEDQSDLTDEIASLRDELEVLEAKLIHYETDALHTCHANCKRHTCVITRQLAVAMEALRFYGDKDNWLAPDIFVPYWTLRDDGANVGSGKASDALRRIEEIGKK